MKSKEERNMCEFTYKLSEDQEGYIITSVNTQSKDVIIPNVYDGKPVIGIASNAFNGNGCSNMSKLTMPNSIKSIGENAFHSTLGLKVYITDITSWLGISFANRESNPLHIYGKLYLKNKLVKDLVIPEGVTGIGNYAFVGCDSLESVTISGSVTNIGNYAFEKCHNLESVTILEGVSSIGDYAFRGCYLFELVIPSTMRYIGCNAFESGSNRKIYIKDITNWLGICFANRESNPMALYRKISPAKLYVNNELVNDLVIPEGVTSIGDYAFIESGLNSVVIPNTVTSIGKCAFSKCSYLTRVVVPDSVTKIGFRAFADCASLTCAIIPDSVTAIGEGAFKGCVGLQRPAIPDDTTSISKEEALKYFAGLHRVVIPNGVTQISKEAFRGSAALASVYIW